MHRKLPRNANKCEYKIRDTQDSRVFCNSEFNHIYYTND